MRGRASRSRGRSARRRPNRRARRRGHRCRRHEDSSEVGTSGAGSATRRRWRWWLSGHRVSRDHPGARHDHGQRGWSGLIGRRVDLRVIGFTRPERRRVLDQRERQPLLVMLGRDTRDESGTAASGYRLIGIAPCTQVGRHDRLRAAHCPRRKRCAAGDCAARLRRVRDRKLYIRADTVTTNGRGTRAGL